MAHPLHHITRLDNGLVIVTASLPHMASVSVGVWAAVGGRHESAPLNGVAHFIEHMLFKGTRRRSAERISQDVEGIGGYLNAFTSEEHTCFHARAHHSRLEDLVECEEIFSTLMGEDVESRRKFIEDNALDVRNLDV